MNRLQNWWIRFSMKYLGYRYYIDPASIPPAPTSGIHAHGHAWWGKVLNGPHESDRFYTADVMSRCPCGARLYYRRKGETEDRFDPEALLECPMRERNEREKRARG
jgi:hypothetical protein